MRAPSSQSFFASRFRSKSRTSSSDRRWHFRIANAAGWVVESLEARTLYSVIIPTVPVPAAHWTLDDGTGTIAADSSGNGHTVTLSAGAS